MSTEVEQNRFAPPEAHVEDVAPGDAEAAGRGKRLLAVLIDGVLQGLIFWLIASAMLPGLFSRVARGQVGLVATVTYVLAGFALFVALNGWLLHTQGQTIGKKLLGLRIVRSNGERASFGRLIGLRYGVGYLIVMIPFIGKLYGLVDALAIFRQSRQCVHDNIADTIVVKA